MAPLIATAPVAMVVTPRRPLIQRRLSPIVLLLSPTVMTLWSPTTTRLPAAFETAALTFLLLRVMSAGSERPSSDTRLISFDLTAVTIPP